MHEECNLLHYTFCMMGALIVFQKIVHGTATGSGLLSAGWLGEVAAWCGY